MFRNGPLIPTLWMSVFDVYLPLLGKRSYGGRNHVRNRVMSLCNFSRCTHSVYHLLHRGYWSASKQPHHSSSRTYCRHRRMLGCRAVRQETGGNTRETPRIIYRSSLFIFQNRVSLFFVWYVTCLVSVDGIKTTFRISGIDLRGLQDIIILCH